MKKKLWMIPLLTVSLLTASCAANSTIGYTKLETYQSLIVHLPESIVRYDMDTDKSYEYYYLCNNSDVFVKTFYYQTINEERELWSIRHNRYYNVTYEISEVWREI